MPEGDDAEKVWTTLLRLPHSLRERILAQGKIDRREMKPEILTLLEEAVASREKKQG